VLEAQAARRWYAERDPRAAERFMLALDDALVGIAGAPGAWPPFGTGTRRVVLRRFPYQVIFRAISDGLEVVAVMHERRRPGYWRQR